MLFLFKLYNCLILPILAINPEIFMEIEDQINSLKNCISEFKHIKNVDEICFKLIHLNQNDLQKSSISSHGMSRRKRSVIFEEMVGPKCTDGPCQRQNFFISKRVSKYILTYSKHN
jgi:hypothetical protein